MSNFVFYQHRRLALISPLCLGMARDITGTYYHIHTDTRDQTQGLRQSRQLILPTELQPQSLIPDFLLLPFLLPNPFVPTVIASKDFGIFSF